MVRPIHALSLSLVLLVFCLAAPDATAQAAPVPTTPGIYTRSMTHDGLTRYYVIAIPDGYTAAQRAPLALIFHGSGQNARIFAHKRWELVTSPSPPFRTAMAGPP